MVGFYFFLLNGSGKVVGKKEIKQKT